MIVRGSCPHRLKILACEALPERPRTDEFDVACVHTEEVATFTSFQFESGYAASKPMT